MTSKIVKTSARRSALFFLVGTAAVATVSVAAPARASATRNFHQSTAKDFEEGEATGSMIQPTGEVVPGMKATAVEAPESFTWCSTLSRDGSVAYFGGGDDGKIYAVETKAGKSEKARLVATLDAPWVTSLAVRADGSLLAGTTPGGRLFTVDPRSGASKEFAKLPAEHLWAIVYDDKAATAYVGTGAPGKVFAVDAHGKARALWDSRDKHVVSLMRDDASHLLAGTSEEAILYRVSLDGRGEAVQDFEAEEVRAVARSGDGVTIAVNDFDKTSTPLGFGPPAAKGTKIVISAGGPPSSAGALPRPGARKSKAALYRLENDGRLEQIFAIPDGYFTALSVDEKTGDVYASTGTQGRVYRVRPDRTAGLAIDLPERQALTLVPTRAGGELGFLVGTGDTGGVYRVRAASGGGESTYLSKVFDAEMRSHWGLLRWRGTKGLSIETRSGITSKPDEGWSSFQKLQETRASFDGGAGQVASPASRYVQYRVTLAGADARLAELSLAYLPQNQRARVTEFTTTDGSAAGGAPPAPGMAAARAHSNVLKLRWKVENPDGDELAYRLSFREANEASWRPLGGPDALSKPEYDWNTEGIPDGSYVVRVVVSDERAQPRERVLDYTYFSPPVLVDNRKPEVAGLAAKYPFVSGRARDAASPITQIEMAVDGAEWHEVAPADGICDDLVESFTVKLPALTPGPHDVTVRAWDSADNVGAASISVQGSK